MPQTELQDIFDSTRSALEDLGVEDDFFLDLVSLRLLVERIGESDNLGWWDSRVFSETGRDRLEEVVPKTREKARIDLATKVGRKAESDSVPDDALTLFWFGPRMESRLDAVLDEITGTESNTFEALEKLDLQSVDAGWSAPLAAAVSGEDLDVDSVRSSVSPGNDDSIPLADSAYAQDEVETDKRVILESLVREYGASVDELCIPFYGLNQNHEAKTS